MGDVGTWDRPNPTETEEPPQNVVVEMPNGLPSKSSAMPETESRTPPLAIGASRRP